MAMREEYAPWDGKWIGYDWFKLLVALILLLLLIGAWLAFGGPPPRLPPLRAPIVSAPAAGATLPPGAVTFSGQATPGSTVRVVIDGTPVGTATADGSGAWSLTTTLDRAGQYQVVAEALRPDGTVAARSALQNLIVSAPAIAAPTLNLPNRVPLGSVNFSGEGAPGSTVEVLVDGQPIGRTTVGADGRWSLTGNVAAGERQVIARVIDASGAPAAAAPASMLMVIAPPLITSLRDGAQVTAGRLTLSGTGQPGSQIEIRDGDRVLGIATVGADGSWSFAYDATPGTLQLSARLVGDPASASAPLRETVNPAVAEVPPLITSLRDGAQVTAGRLTLSGTGQPGSQIEIRDGDRVLGTVTVGTDGSWSFAYDASPGTLQLSARSVGDPASASAPLRVTVNPAAAAPPAQPGGTGAQPGGTGVQPGGADIPAALPRTGGDSIPWGALAMLTAALLGSGIWMRLRR
ncbi:MAG: LPXTG cell wall anchor domain-containing protein [Roseiflexus sp.]|nr:LPXTG cell wall anchor domain-containing protein [Roseiflexus sp.]